MNKPMGCILGIVTLISLASTSGTAEKEQDVAKTSKVPPACNFQASFMTWDLPPRKDPRPYSRHNIPLGNKARIQVDAIIDVIDEDSGKTERFVLIAPCRSEWVYAPDKLFQIPSGEYRCIYSLTQERSMGRAITFQGEATRGHPVTNSFRSLAIDIKTFAKTKSLGTAAAICSATEANIPLIARTEIRDPKRKERYILEYPIKTMNYRPETPSVQVDTGPLLVPDFTSRAKSPIDRLEMAHVAYNRLDRAEFILRRPTPIANDEGKELARVLHYSEVREYPARNQMLCGE